MILADKEAEIVSEAESKVSLHLSSDEELMRQVAGGNAPAFEVLYKRHAVECLSFALSIVRQPLTAEDVVQETFVKLWRQASAFSMEKGRFASWLLTVVHNCAIDKLRMSKAVSRRVTIVSLDNEYGDGARVADMLPDTGPTPYDYAWSEERGWIIGNLLNVLEESQREAITLAYFEGFTYREIAERLNQPLNTIKTRIRLGRERMRHLMISYGLSYEML
jgi:RNA polymerase sigma-70 factor (ECF subfamily)